MESKELLTKRKIESLASEYAEEEFTPTDADRYDVFVSHSSSDKDFIKKVLTFLHTSKGGVNGYVDWQDPEMPSITDINTAIQLKSRIQKSKKVIYVVTNESLKSVWCSWEIGFADKDKGVDKIAILAIKPNNGKWKSNEYLQQYPWIGFDQKRKLFLVHMNNGVDVTLSEWIFN